MSSTGPIGRVSLLSTGSVRIRPDHVASTWRPMLWWLLTARAWTAPRPINVYVIEHREGIVLFDTGQDRASVTDPHYFPGGFTGFLYDRLASFDIGPAETLTAQLDALGYRTSDVHTAVVSHLHQDHIGGLGELIGANILVSDAEAQSVAKPMPEVRGLMPRHIKLPGMHLETITTRPTDDPALAPFAASHDLFGDGSLTLLHTPGHTPGSMSMLVKRSDQPPLLLVGDLTYDAHLLECGHVPGVGSRRQLRHSTEMVNALAEHQPGLTVLAAHDPGAAGRLAAVGGRVIEHTL